MQTKPVTPPATGPMARGGSKKLEAQNVKATAPATAPKRAPKQALASLEDRYGANQEKKGAKITPPTKPKVSAASVAKIATRPGKLDGPSAPESTAILNNAANPIQITTQKTITRMTCLIFI